MQVSIYVPEDKVAVWEKIKKNAESERQGIGYILIRSWERDKAATK